jgi:hypothetical protein
MTTHTPLRCANSFMVQRGSNEVVLMDTGAYPGVSNFLNETWTFNGTDWTNTGTTLIDANGPLPGRINMVMAYDGYNVMLYGGQGDSSTVGYLSDTWTWNGTAWSKKSPATVPFGRNFKNDTWSFNGTTWTQLNPATSPSARAGHCMAYDQTNNVWVLFGGMNEYYRLPETWTFNGTTWTQAAPATSPSGLTWAQMCWDTQSGRILLFGGYSATDNFAAADTWSWNGTTWTKL